MKELETRSPIGVDARIITATNKNLKELIKERKFREDLFYRINVIPIILPPLHERMDDVPLLVKSFIEQMQVLTKKEITGMTAEAMNLFMTYRWPGNVRELKAALEYAFVIKDSGLISDSDLPGTFSKLEMPTCATIIVCLKMNAKRRRP